MQIPPPKLTSFSMVHTWLLVGLLCVCKSISTNAQYVTLHWKSSMRFTNLISQIESEYTRRLLRPWENAQLSEPTLEASNKHSQILVYLLLPVSDWLDSLIGPSGLLLVVVVPHQLAVPVSVLWVELEKKKLVTKNLDVRNMFGGWSHTEHWWRYSKRPKEGCVPEKKGAAS